MNYKICSVCGKFYKDKNNKKCRDCFLKDKEDYARVKDFIIKNNKPNILEVSKATKTDIKTILRFVKEGMIESDSIDKDLKI